MLAVHCYIAVTYLENVSCVINKNTIFIAVIDHYKEKKMSNYTRMSPPASPTSSSFSNGDPAQGKQETRLTATAKRQKYLRRLLKFKQMDFEYAIWQMIYLFVSPQKV